MAALHDERPTDVGQRGALDAQEDGRAQPDDLEHLCGD